MNTSSSALLHIKQLTTQLQVGKEQWTVVDQLSFSLYPGKTLALVGESGCGKSMTALSIMRILPSPPALTSTGKILYKDLSLLELSEKKMRTIRGDKIAMIFQDPMSALNPVYTIANQLIEVAELHLNLYGNQAYECALSMLKSVGISQADRCLHSYPHQLSGGLKQRVMIAMALMCHPDILIADEPTTALDVTIQAQVLQLMRAKQSTNHMALLLITHDMGVVAEMADEAIVMYMAQNIEYAIVQDLFNTPLHPYTIGLFNSRPLIDRKQIKLEPISGQVPLFNHIPKGCRFHPRCPYAMEKCKQGEVPYFNKGQNSHQVKCWLYDETDESAQKLLELRSRVKK